MKLGDMGGDGVAIVKEFNGGKVGVLVGAGGNTRRADLESEQERRSGVMAEVTRSNPACMVCSMCASLSQGTQRMISPV